jgi:hypothetical protein
MAPRNDLSSTRYCLASPGQEYLVYQPTAGATFAVELEPGDYQAEWFDPAGGTSAAARQLETTGGAHRFETPFPSDTVLYLKRTGL